MIKVYFNSNIVSCFKEKTNNLNEKCAGAAKGFKDLNDFLGRQSMSIVEEQLMHHFFLESCFTCALWWFFLIRTVFFCDYWYFLSMCTYYQHKKTRLQIITPFFCCNFEMTENVTWLKHSFNINKNFVIEDTCLYILYIIDKKFN